MTLPESTNGVVQIVPRRRGTNALMYSGEHAAARSPSAAQEERGGEGVGCDDDPTGVNEHGPVDADDAAGRHGLQSRDGEEAETGIEVKPNLELQAPAASSHTLMGVGNIFKGGVASDDPLIRRRMGGKTVDLDRRKHRDRAAINDRTRDRKQAHAHAAVNSDRRRKPLGQLMAVEHGPLQASEHVRAAGEHELDGVQEAIKRAVLRYGHSTAQRPIDGPHRAKALLWRDPQDAPGTRETDTNPHGGSAAAPLGGLGGDEVEPARARDCRRNVADAKETAYPRRDLHHVGRHVGRAHQAIEATRDQDGA